MGGAEELRWTNAFNFHGRYQSGVVRNPLVGDVQYMRQLRQQSADDFGIF